MRSVVAVAGIVLIGFLSVGILVAQDSDDRIKRTRAILDSLGVDYDLKPVASKSTTRFDDLGFSVLRVQGNEKQYITVAFDPHSDPSGFVVAQYGGTETNALEEDAIKNEYHSVSIDNYDFYGTASHPRCYQKVDGKRVEVDARFVKIRNTELLRLWVGEYDPSLPLLCKYSIGFSRSDNSVGNLNNKLPPPEK